MFQLFKTFKLYDFSKYLRDFDPFKEQKNQALQQSMTAINNLALHLSSIVEANSTSALQQNFIDLLQVIVFVFPAGCLIL